MLALRVINQAIASFIDYFVAQWVNWEKLLDGSAVNNTEESNSLIDEKRQSFVNYYIIIIIAFVILILNAEFSFFYSLIRASKNLHDYMFRGLTQTYMQFFNQNPSGRILNRFSKDIGSIDTQLPNTLFECICVSLLLVRMLKVFIYFLGFYISLLFCFFYRLSKKKLFSVFLSKIFSRLRKFSGQSKNIRLK